MALSKELQENIEILSYGSPERRVKAVQRLGRIRTKECVPPLLLALNDTYYLVRVVAVQSLSWIDLESVIPDLLDRMKVETNNFVKKQLVETLTPYVDKSVVNEAFKAQLNDTYLDLELSELITNALTSQDRIR